MTSSDFSSFWISFWPLSIDLLSHTPLVAILSKVFQFKSVWNVYRWNPPKDETFKLPVNKNTGRYVVLTRDFRTRQAWPHVCTLEWVFLVRDELWWILCFLKGIMRTAQNTRFIRSIFLLLYLHLHRFHYMGRSWWVVSLRVRICRIQSSHDTTWLSKEEHLRDRTGTRETHDCPFVRWAESLSSWHSSNSGHLKYVNIYMIMYA